MLLISVRRHLLRSSMVKYVLATKKSHHSEAQQVRYAYTCSIAFSHLAKVARASAPRIRQKHATVWQIYFGCTGSDDLAAEKEPGVRPPAVIRMSTSPITSLISAITPFQWASAHRRLDGLCWIDRFVRGQTPSRDESRSDKRENSSELSTTIVSIYSNYPRLIGAAGATHICF